MIRRTLIGAVACSLLLGLASGARAQAPAADTELQWLVPEMKGAGLRVSPGPRQFLRAFAFSPGIGRLGDEDLFALRLAYNPNPWLAWEVALGHNPTSSLQALLHTFNAVVRKPLPWRVQPYLTAGYGMMTVYPGRAIEADPVTKNAVTYGGGLEIYLRNDVALRGEMRAATVFGQEAGREGTATYTYREYTAGIVFYRKLGS
ncbi:MAG: hypothetical protein IPH48_21955 [bacterium]|nr:hypothetical protein [bacterium]